MDVGVAAWVFPDGIWAVREAVEENEPETYEKHDDEFNTRTNHTTYLWFVCAIGQYP